MALEKVEYRDKKVIISAKNMNDIQDAVIELQAMVNPIIGDAAGNVISLTDSSDLPIHRMTIYGNTTQDGTPTPDAPVELASVGDSGSICVTVSEKNIFKYVGEALMENGSVIDSTPSGCTVQGIDGGVATGSTAWSNGWVHFDRASALYLTAGSVITLSADYTVLEKHPSAIDKVTILLEYVSGATTLDIVNAEIGVKYRISKTFVIPTDGKYKRTTFTTHSGKVKIENVQWEFGSSASNFVPYRENTFSISTPNGLPGIPVASGGNYTDANGQQWVCDEIDLAAGVYVQRIKYSELDADSVRWKDGVFTAGTSHYIYLDDPSIVITNGSLYSHGTYELNGILSDGKYCSSGAGYFQVVTGLTLDEWRSYLTEQKTNGTPASLLYPLATPIETPLSEEELAAYAALHTYRYHATVSNDAGAYMELEYVQDTKKYIDQKFDELKVQLSK